MNRVVGRDQPSVTVVLAPAGFGKSTLLTEWFAGGDPDDPAMAWLSLDTADNDPSQFWSYVIAALQTVAPQVGETALALLRSDPSGLEPAVVTLVNDLDVLPKDVVLVLDDYHVIESAEIHDTVAFLIDHLPPQVHLALASRSDPPLPLARLRARGELLEVRAADLRFTVEEAAADLAGKSTTIRMMVGPAGSNGVHRRRVGHVLELVGLTDVAGGAASALAYTLASEERKQRMRHLLAVECHHA